jgi:hypothetical protein
VPLKSRPRSSPAACSTKADPAPPRTPPALGKWRVPPAGIFEEEEDQKARALFLFFFLLIFCL